MPSGRFVVLVLVLILAGYWWVHNVPTKVGDGTPICLPRQATPDQRSTAR